MKVVLLAAVFALVGTDFMPSVSILFILVLPLCSQLSVKGTTPK